MGQSALGINRASRGIWFYWPWPDRFNDHF